MTPCVSRLLFFSQSTFAHEKLADATNRSLSNKISATDFPLLTAAEMGAVMGTFVESRINFVTGSAMMEQNRAELYVDDQVRGVGRSECTGGAALV